MSDGFIVEIDGELGNSPTIYTTLKHAQSGAVEEAESSGSTELSVVIYELKEVLSGNVAVDIKWTSK